MVIALLVEGLLLALPVVSVLALAVLVAAQVLRGLLVRQELQVLELSVGQEEQVVQQVLRVEQALQALRALRVLQAQQGLSGRIYRVKLMLHILTWEQEMEQHRD
jgi:hypothetical protein